MLHQLYVTQATCAYYSMCLQATLSCEGCSTRCTTYTTARGIVTDGPEKYSNDAVCEWMIAPTNASIVMLSFTHVSTEGGADRIYMYECPDPTCSTSFQISRVSGVWADADMSQLSYSCRTGYMKVKFTSNEKVVDSGFVATWTSVRTCMSPSLSLEKCQYAHRACKRA